MQDNPFDKKFMDDAWSQMNSQLNEVMPQERKRRFVFWWWFLPSLGVAALLVAMMLPKSIVPSQPRETIDDPTALDQKQQPIARLETESSINTEVDPIKSKSELITKNTISQAPTTRNNQKLNQPTNKATNNNPIIPKKQDPVIEPAFQNPEAIVLHTATEKPKSDQRIAPAVPVTDLRFLSTFDLLTKPSSPIYALTDISPQLINTNPMKVSKLYNRRGTAAAFLSAGYNTQAGKGAFAAGLGWKQQNGRFFLRLEPGLAVGSTVMTPSNNASLDEAAMDIGNGTNFDPQAEPDQGAIPNNITADQQRNFDAQFASLSIPFTLGYQFKEKWSLEGGLQWSHALSLKATQVLNESAVNRLQNGATSAYAIGQENANLRNLLSQPSWLEGRMALNYRWSKRLELQAAYRFGQVDFESANLTWNRDQYALRLRYRLR
ncbi:MAG: hypothetical protein Sapg2KO_09060 [Saprospiraceae bacterium]